MNELEHTLIFIERQRNRELMVMMMPFIVTKMNLVNITDPHNAGIKL